VVDAGHPDPRAEWWTTSDVAAYLGVQVGTVSSYRIRGQMPEPDRTEGRTHVWRPARIVEWHERRPRLGVGGRPESEAGVSAGHFIEVSTATESKDAAVELARRAVEAKLAAGAQITGPTTSVFWHLGEFGTGEEWRLVLRTHVSRFDELEALLLRYHPWKNPEILATEIAAGSAEYLEWLRRTVDASRD
jgi:uncharacterized protein involved in tolerance to divalent cations